MSYVKIGVGGPVGSGKTALIERLTRIMSKEYSICVITNDIYTKEDAEFLIKNSALPPERIVGVETGGCPHTAIREDCSMNLEAVDEMASDSQRMRQGRKFLFSNLMSMEGVDEIIDWIKKDVLFEGME